MVDIDAAKINPSSVFKRPSDVLKEKSLSRELKIDILRRWAYDEREIAVAEEENMQGVNSDRSNILDDVLKCLLTLGVHTDDKKSPPTKQG